jgi:glycosyltransferase involved in cell wall biosynthesis
VTSKRPRIDVVGIPTGSTGWATHSLEFARALQPYAEVAFRTRKKHAAKCLLGRDAVMLLRGMFQPPGDFCVVVAGKSLSPKRSSRWIVWETTELPAAQHEACAAVEYLWAPSQWGRDNLIANGYAAERIAVVPEGVATHFFLPAARRPERPRFRFLMVGKWEARKFCDGLLRAFTREFKPDEPVELYLQAHNQYVPGFSLADRVAATGVSNEHAIVLGSPCDLVALRELYRSADCFVLPTRAEGWGLPILESMACGVPAIVTRYSAPLAYVTDSNGYFINVARMVEARDAEFGVSTGLWAEPDEAHLQHLMRQAFQNRDERLAKGELATRDAQSFSWDGAARKAVQTTEHILKA